MKFIPDTVIDAPFTHLYLCRGSHLLVSWIVIAWSYCSCYCCMHLNKVCDNMSKGRRDHCKIYLLLKEVKLSFSASAETEV